MMNQDVGGIQGEHGNMHMQGWLETLEKSGKALWGSLEEDWREAALTHREQSKQDGLQEAQLRKHRIGVCKS